MPDLSDLNVTLVTASAMHKTAGSHFKYDNTVVATIDAENQDCTSYLAFDDKGVLSQRNQCVISYFEYLLRNYGRTQRPQTPGRLYTTIFQGDDCPVDFPSAGWESKESYRTLCLLPDFYYTSNDGYRSFLPSDTKAWHSRRTEFFWRGGTTGGWHNTAATLDTLPRYRLCRAGLQFGAQADFGIHNVVQAETEADKESIKARLQQEGLYRGFTPIEDYTNCKFVIQIDGNANSWDLVKRMRLGCCLLIVGSEWIAWHNENIRPWIHYVPVRQDLGDLEEMMTWCLENDRQTQSIASEARRFALGIDYDDEMARAVSLIYENSAVVG